MMRRATVLFVLGAAVFVSAILVVRTSYKARNLQQELQELRIAREHLVTEWAQLRLEESVWANPGRISHIARHRLGMQQPQSFIIVEVKR